MDYDMKNSGKRIQQLRIQHGYTQDELARKLHVNRSLLSYVESGKKGLSVDLLVQLSALLDVSLDCQRRSDFVDFRRTGNVEKWRVNVYSP